MPAVADGLLSLLLRSEPERVAPVEDEERPSPMGRRRSVSGRRRRGTLRLVAVALIPAFGGGRSAVGSSSNFLQGLSGLNAVVTGVSVSSLLFSL